MTRHTRTSALLDVPRVCLPRALQTLAAVDRAARCGDDLAERALPRLRACLERGRAAWREAERQRSEDAAQLARRHFDEVSTTAPPHIRTTPDSSRF